MTTYPKKLKVRTYTCGTCGKTSTSTRRQRRCKRLRPNGRYYCWGLLTRKVKAKAKPPTIDKKIARAEAALKANMRRLRAASTRVKVWQKRLAKLYNERIEQQQAAARAQAEATAFIPAAESGRHARAIDLREDE